MPLMDESDIRHRLLNLTNGFGPFVPSPDSDHSQMAEQMQLELSEIENAIQQYRVSDLYYELAVALQNYTAWYVRGDERKTQLQRIVAYLRCTLSGSNSTAAKIELARLLIEEKQVRDLEAALKLVEELSSHNKLPDYMSSIVEKAKRWAGKVSVPKDSDFSTLNASPASIQEERTKLRKMLTSLIKTHDSRAGVVAKRLYNLGLLAAYLYDHYDGSSGVSGAEFDAAVSKMKRANRLFSFDYLGRITDAQFLTAADYKRIEKILGSSETSISLDQIRISVSSKLAP
jgi:hypothetical protein